MANRFESLACADCGKMYPLDANQRCLSCGGILDARYDLENGFPAEFDKKSVWDFADFLPPVRKESIVSMGEGWTPYTETPNLAKTLGLRSLRCKVEGSNPTGSFKDRAASLGVSLAKDWGKAGVFTASDGNAAAAVSAYSARARIRCLVVVNEGIPASKLGQILIYSPEILRVAGLYDSLPRLESTLAELGRILSRWRNLFLWAPYNPLIVDAFKTIAYEIALSGELPDLVFVPTAGGDLLYGLYKGFMELRKLGRLERIPGIVAVQGQGADATVQAIEQGLDRVRESGPPLTIASALRVNFGAEHSLKAVRGTHGFGISVPNGMILDAQRQIARDEGIFCEISSAVSVAAIRKALDTELMDRDQSAAAILTGFGLKEYSPIGEDTLLIPSVASESELSSVLGELLRINSKGARTAEESASS